MTSEGSERERGSALIMALIAVMMTLSLVLVLSQLAHINTQRVRASRTDHQLVQAARVGLAQGRHEVWERFMQGGGGDLAAFRDHLDGLGLADGEERWLDQDAAGLSREEVALISRRGRVSTAPIELRIRIRREDRTDPAGTSTYLFLQSTARRDGAARTVETVLRVSAPVFEGFEYALLGGSLDEVFDRTRLRHIRRRYGTGAGPVPRIKAGATNRLRLPDDSRTRIDGTLYVRGGVEDEDGNPATVPQGGKNGIRMATIDPTDGSTRAPYVDPVDGSPGQVPFAGYYSDYPSDPSQQFDGVLPSGVPSAVPDVDGDRFIDDAEWSSGTLEYGGRLTGTLVALKPGATYLTPALPSAGVGLVDSGFVGNVILVGTPAAPIQIDGTVAIDGDVVLSGYVQGTGTLLARGNLYIIGDLQYADGVDGAGARTFGVAPDGSQNLIGYAALGSILHGPYNVKDNGALIPEVISDADLEGFVGTRIGDANLREWAPTQPNFDPGTDLPTSAATGVVNAGHDPDHIPRFYTLDGGQPVQAGQDGRTWDNTLGRWLGKPSGGPDDAIDLSTLKEGEHYHLNALNPQGRWISGSLLAILHATTDAARIRTGPYQVDGLLYSSNALFLTALKNSKGGGRIEVSGAVIGADVAASTHGEKKQPGLTIDYDPRVLSLLNVEDPGAAQVQVYRVLTREQ